MTSLFPMFMKLTGKRCLVVGAGKVGEPKIGGLIDTGARIHVVAIAASDQVREWARRGEDRTGIARFHGERPRRQVSGGRGDGFEKV